MPVIKNKRTSKAMPINNETNAPFIMVGSGCG
jgi:hypothetical protein